MAEFPALPLWTDALLADCGHLSDADFGRYLKLLILIWRSPQCRIPDDSEWIARKLNRAYEEVVIEWRPLIQEFCQTHKGWVKQKKLSNEYLYVSKRREQRSLAAKARWQKQKDLFERNAGSHASRNAPTPTPTPTPKQKTKTPTGASHDASVVPLDKILFDRGKEVLGKKAGGVINKLKTELGIGRALEIIEEAATKNDPMEYVQGALRGKKNEGWAI